MRSRRKTTNIDTDNLRSIHVVILGQDSVGKSALTVRLLTRRFIGEYDSTLESAYRHPFEVDKEVVVLDVLDTAGRNTDRKLAIFAESSDIFVILYSITDRISFGEAEKIAKKIIRNASLSEQSILLVGTKTDLEHLREVSSDEGKQLAKKMNCIFYEISISEGFTDTINMFRDAVGQFLETRTNVADAQAPLSSPLTNTSGLVDSYSNLASAGAKVDRSNPRSIMSGLRTTFTRRKPVPVL